MQCPRCQITLRRDQYEGVDVDYCSECWGYWLDHGELATIAQRQKLKFSADESKAMAKAFAGKVADPRQTLPAACPRCGTAMTHVTFAGDTAAASIIIDRCPAHGVWLDTGELKALQVFAEGRTAAQKKSQGDAFNVLLHKLRG